MGWKVLKINMLVLEGITRIESRRSTCSYSVDLELSSPKLLRSCERARDRLFCHRLSSAYKVVFLSDTTLHSSSQTRKICTRLTGDWFSSITT
jgi:hypothetical protein